MAGFIVYGLLNQKDAQFAYTGITKWFKANPDRDDCVTETFTVRRGHVKEDILANSEKGVSLVEKTPRKKVTKKAVVKKLVRKSVKKTTKKVARKPVRRSVGRG